MPHFQLFAAAPGFVHILRLLFVKHRTLFSHFLARTPYHLACSPRTALMPHPLAFLVRHASLVHSAPLPRRIHYCAADHSRPSPIASSLCVYFPTCTIPVFKALIRLCLIHMKLFHLRLQVLCNSVEASRRAGYRAAGRTAGRTPRMHSGMPCCCLSHRLKALEGRRAVRSHAWAGEIRAQRAELEGNRERAWTNSSRRENR